MRPRLRAAQQSYRRRGEVQKERVGDYGHKAACLPILAGVGYRLAIFLSEPVRAESIAHEPPQLDVAAIKRVGGNDHRRALFARWSHRQALSFTAPYQYGQKYECTHGLIQRELYLRAFLILLHSESVASVRRIV